MSGITHYLVVLAVDEEDATQQAESYFEQMNFGATVDNVFDLSDDAQRANAESAIEKDMRDAWQHLCDTGMSNLERYKSGEKLSAWDWAMVRLYATAQENGICDRVGKVDYKFLNDKFRPVPCFEGSYSVGVSISTQHDPHDVRTTFSLYESQGFETYHVVECTIRNDVFSQAL